MNWRTLATGPLTSINKLSRKSSSSSESSSSGESSLREAISISLTHRRQSVVGAFQRSSLMRMVLNSVTLSPLVPPCSFPLSSAAKTSMTKEPGESLVIANTKSILDIGVFIILGIFIAIIIYIIDRRIY
jgi:hypothetical protein